MSSSPPSQPSPPSPPSSPSPPDPDGSGRGIRDRISEFWGRHRRLFWTLHSGWALATGVVVVFLARERYNFVPWVVAFLFVTWASTLFFGGRARGEDGESASREDAPDPETREDGGEGRVGAEEGTAAGVSTPGLGEEVTSYATRTLYQETLFFLLPLYAHSTVLGSANVVFVAFLGGLALFSCLDLVFDRWLRTRPAFGMVFFATVAFAALNLLLPMLLGLDPRWATPVAALAAVGSAAPLALQVPFEGLGDRVKVGVLGVALPVVVLGMPSLIPAVPLYAERAVLASRMDRDDLTPGHELDSDATSEEVGDGVYVVFEVLAPSNVPTVVQIVWKRDGRVIRTTRDIEILAHDWGFRVWDGYRPGEGRPVPPGDYVAEIQTRDGRIFGRARVEIR